VCLHWAPPEFELVCAGFPHAIVAAALSLLPGSSAPAALLGGERERVGARCMFGCIWDGAGGWGRDVAHGRGTPVGTITVGVQASGASLPRRLQTRSIGRAPPHRWPPEQLSIEDLRRSS
jgi:hypothetical protein